MLRAYNSVSPSDPIVRLSTLQKKITHIEESLDLPLLKSENLTTHFPKQLESYQKVINNIQDADLTANHLSLKKTLLDRISTLQEHVAELQRLIFVSEPTSDENNAETKTHDPSLFGCLNKVVASNSNALKDPTASSKTTAAFLHKVEWQTVLSLLNVKEMINLKATSHFFADKIGAVQLTRTHLPGGFYCIGKPTIAMLTKAIKKVSRIGRPPDLERLPLVLNALIQENQKKLKSAEKKSGRCIIS